MTDTDQWKEIDAGMARMEMKAFLAHVQKLLGNFGVPAKVWIANGSLHVNIISGAELENVHGVGSQAVPKSEEVQNFVRLLEDANITRVVKEMDDADKA